MESLTLCIFEGFEGMVKAVEKCAASCGAGAAFQDTFSCFAKSSRRCLDWRKDYDGPAGHTPAAQWGKMTLNKHSEEQCDQAGVLWWIEQ